jgi:hypothetical protein
MKDFNIAKYLKENHLGSHAILGNYVDLHALKEAEDLEGLEVVKGFGALKDKKLADKYAEVAKQAGMEDVKVIEKDGVFKIYAKAGQKLNKEEEEMELDTEIPYEGPEHKLDGFGDEFVQDSPVEEVDSMDTDDSVNPFPSLMPDEQGKFDRMMGLIDQSIEPRLAQVKSVIDGAREQGYADRTIFTVLARHPLVKDSIEALVDDGFEFQDIVDFFATDFSQNEEVTVSSSGVQMEKK